jgi:hypothetical protein
MFLNIDESPLRVISGPSELCHPNGRFRGQSGHSTTLIFNAVTGSNLVLGTIHMTLTGHVSRLGKITGETAYYPNQRFASNLLLRPHAKPGSESLLQISAGHRWNWRHW